MLEVMEDLYLTLNKIEVHGETNLALLYNSIHIVKQMRDGYKQNQVIPEETTNDNLATTT